MITSSKEYHDNLWRVNDRNIPHLAILVPETERIYRIDLNTRTIEAPEYLGVETDHRSEIIYFQVDRFYDAMDLSTTSCIIEYCNNTTGKNGYYTVPFYDITTFASSDTDQDNYIPKIVFPWCLDKNVTEKAGVIEYSIRFFETSESGKLIYNLNTIPAKSKILKTLKITREDIAEENIPQTFRMTRNGEEISAEEEYKDSPDATSIENLLERVSRLEGIYELFWGEMK